MGERFTATGDFIRENRKVLFKNLFPAGVILAVLMGFFMQDYVKSVYFSGGNPVTLESINWFAYTGMMIVAIVFSLFIYAMSGAILGKYAEGSLTPETGWADLKGKFFSIAGKIFVQYCIVVLLLIALAVILAVPIFLLLKGPWLIMGSLLFTLLFCVIILLLMPVFVLMSYPVYFESASAWAGIKQGFRWGFRYWGSTLATLLLGGLLLCVVYYILAMPYILYLMFGTGAAEWLGSLLAALVYVTILLLNPIYIIFLAFQYTSILEKEKAKG
jgi:hypothetical protein